MGAERTRFFRLLAAVLLIAATSIAVVAQGTPTEGVRLYDARDGVGMGQGIPVGTFQVDGKQLSPGSGTEPNVSVRVSKDYFIRFCAQKDGSGKCEEFGEGTHNLTSADFNFLKVWKGAASSAPAAAVSSSAPVGTPAAMPSVKPLVVFEQKHWLGRSQTFGLGMYRSYRAEFGKLNDNQARSVVIAKGFRARFCSEEGINFRGAGDCEVHEEGRHNLRFANSISFIEVTDLADPAPADEKMPVVLYEDASQAGKMQGFDVGSFSASSGQFLKLANDTASSIAVKDGYRVSVCADEPLSGGDGANCEEFSSGKKNLKNRKSASYIKVWKSN